MAGFAAGATVRALHDDQFKSLPKACGVYVVLRNPADEPRFLTNSGAGWFKGHDPSYPAHIVRSAWRAGASVVYIGKAGGVNGLRRRVRELITFGLGKPVGHRGGRMLWHLADHESLHVRWMECPCDKADAMESELIERFRVVHTTRPLANRMK